MLADFAKTNCLRAGFGVVFRALNCLTERGEAAGDDALHLFWVGTEGGRTFAGIEHAESPARAGAAVKKPSTVFEGIDHPAHYAEQPGFLGLDGSGYPAVLVEEQVDRLAKRQSVKVHRARMPLLGGRLAKLCQLGNGDGGRLAKRSCDLV